MAFQGARSIGTFGRPIYIPKDTHLNDLPIDDDLLESTPSSSSEISYHRKSWTITKKSWLYSILIVLIVVTMAALAIVFIVRGTGNRRFNSNYQQQIVTDCNSANFWQTLVFSVLRSIWVQIFERYSKLSDLSARFPIFCNMFKQIRS